LLSNDPFLSFWVAVFAEKKEEEEEEEEEEDEDSD
jgi:hypothetical protein